MKGKEKQSRMVHRNPEEKVANEECCRKGMLRVLSEANCDLHKSSFHDVRPQKPDEGSSVRCLLNGKIL